MQSLLLSYNSATCLNTEIQEKKHCKEMNHILHYMDFTSQIYQRQLLSVLLDHTWVAAQL